MNAPFNGIDSRKINEHPKGAIEFIKIFMRFEFALKESGFCRQEGKKLEICWDKFANDESIGQEFFRSIRKSAKAQMLIKKTTKPPSGSRFVAWLG